MPGVAEHLAEPGDVEEALHGDTGAEWVGSRKRAVLDDPAAEVQVAPQVGVVEAVKTGNQKDTAQSNHRRQSGAAGARKPFHPYHRPQCNLALIGGLPVERGRVGTVHSFVGRFQTSTHRKLNSAFRTFSSCYKG